MKVNSVKKSSNNNQQNNARASVITVKPGDSISKLANKFGLNTNEFKQWVGLNNNTLKIGQKIQLPMAEIKNGGLSAFAKANGMTLKEFAALNGIKNPNTYKPKKGEKFYVFNKKNNKPETNSKITKKTTEHPETKNNEIKKSQEPIKQPVKEVPKTTEKPTTKIPEGRPEVVNGKMVIPEGGYVGDRKIGVIDPNDPNGPKPVDEKGNVVAEVVRFEPSISGKLFGDLRGNTIMVNAGHGWGNDSYPDGGAPTKDKDGNLVREWDVARGFANKLIKELTSRGATVIYTTGTASKVIDAKEENKADFMISLHCNSAGKAARGMQIYYPNGSDDSKNVANKIGKDMAEYDADGKVAIKSDKETRHRSNGLLQAKNNEKEIPSILIELGFQSNPEDLEQLLSEKFRKDSMDQLAEAITEYMTEGEMTIFDYFVQGIQNGSMKY